MDETAQVSFSGAAEDIEALLEELKSKLKN